MLALCLTFLLTIIFALAGASVFLLAWKRFELIELFLSPAMGAAVFVISCLTLGRMGLPVENFSWPVLIAWLLVFCVSLLLSWKKSKISLPLRDWGSVLFFAIVAVLLIAWPMLHFGFRWLSYTNEDMLNYTLSASYFLHHGYLTYPNALDVLHDRDFSNAFWFFDVFNQERVGVDYLLAFVFKVTGLHGTRAFMPLLIALHAAMLMAAAGLVLAITRSRLAAFFAALFLVFGAVPAHGAEYQLLGQEGGLAFLCLAATCLHRLVVGAERENLLVAGIAVGALGLAYPELLPLLALATLLQIGLRARKEGLRFVRVSVLLLGVAAMSLLTWNVQIPQIAILLHQRLASQSEVFLRASYEHLYLVPSGVASLFGLLSLSSQLPDPWLSMLIAVGLGLFLFLILHAFKQAWNGSIAACVMIVMLAMVFAFFKHGSGFALFKLAMYCQPFLFAVFAIAAANAYRRGGLRRALSLACVAALLLANIATQQYYVKQSTTLFLRDNAFLQVREASGANLVGLLTKEASQDPGMLISDTENPALGTLIAVYARKSEFLSPSWDIVPHIAGADIAALNPFVPRWELNQGAQMMQSRFHSFKVAFYRLPQPNATVSYGLSGMARQKFRVLPDGKSSPDNLFLIDTRLADPASTRDVVVSRPPITCLNSFEPSPDAAPLAVVPLRDVHNHLIFVRSSQGGMYLDDVARYMGLYQYENDVLSDKTMVAMGRHLLFNVLNPSDTVRLVLDISNTVRTNNAQLPDPIALGTMATAPAQVYGRGSARIVLPPIRPMLIDGQAFVALDMRQEPVSIEPPRTGLMRLFGNDVPLDPRKFVVYTRGISAISEAEYRALKPPTQLASFPKDLIDDRSLEYSGIYEDGWASEDFAVRLSTVPGRLLTVKGVVPQIDDPKFTTQATVFVDGAAALRKTLGVGSFSLQVPAPARSVATLRVRFSRVQHLPGGDHRVASVLLSQIGSAPLDVAQQAAPVVDTTSAGPIELGSGWYALERYGGRTFHWMQDSADVRTHADDARVLSLDVEPGPGVAQLPAEMEVSGDGVAPTRERLTGRTMLRIPVAPGAHTIHLRVLNGGRHIASDARILDVRAFSLDFSKREAHAARRSKGGSLS